MQSHNIGTLGPEAGGSASRVRKILSHKDIGYFGRSLCWIIPAALFLKLLTSRYILSAPASSTYGFTPKLIYWIQESDRSFHGVVVHGLCQYHRCTTWKALASIHGDHPMRPRARTVVGGRREYLIFTYFRAAEGNFPNCGRQLI